MTEAELIQQFIQTIGSNTWTVQEVEDFFKSKGIEPCEIMGSLFSTPGIHNLNGNVWYSMAVVKLPPCQ